MSEEVKRSEKPELTEAEINDRAVFEEAAREHESQAEQENQQTIAEVSTREILAPIIHSAFMILCPNWKVKEKESGQLATVWGAVLDKYYPDGVMNQFGLEIAAISTTAMIVLPRLKVPRNEPEQQSNKQSGGESEVQRLDN